MKSLCILSLSLLLPAALCQAEEGAGQDKWDRINYSLGNQIGSDLRRQGMEIDPALLAEGIQDAHAGLDPRISREEMQHILKFVKQKIMEDKRQEIIDRIAQKKERIEKYRGEGREFLEANAKKPGVISLPSGLQYKVIKEGSGRSPGLQDTVSVRYRGTLIDGSEFSNTFAAGKVEKYRVDAVIPGWTEALQLMKEGAKWQLFIPADLAFGERGPLAERTIIYELELVAVEAGEVNNP